MTYSFVLFVSDTRFHELVSVTVTMLSETLTTVRAKEWLEGEMLSDVVLHVADLRALLLADFADQQDARVTCLFIDTPRLYKVIFQFVFSHYVVLVQ